MRYLIGLYCLFAATLTNAHAVETQIFVIANHPDGYGIDRCLSKGEKCGQSMASAYCRNKSFMNAVAYRRVDQDEITGEIPGARACKGGMCQEFVAITCER